MSYTAGESTAYREDRGGSELEYRVTWIWTPPVPATHLDPPEGGVELDQAFIDGREIGLDELPDDVIDALVVDAEAQCTGTGPGKPTHD